MRRLLTCLLLLATSAAAQESDSPATGKVATPLTLPEWKEKLPGLIQKFLSEQKILPVQP